MRRRRQCKWREHIVRRSNGEPQRNERRGGKNHSRWFVIFWFSHVRSAAINSNYHYTTHWSALVDRTTIVGPNANVFGNRKSSTSIQRMHNNNKKVKKNAETKLKMKYTNSILSCCLLFIFGLFWCREISGEKTAKSKAAEEEEEDASAIMVRVAFFSLCYFVVLHQIW